ncbi:MAG: hypothetical protein LUF90_05905 [Rikenellaceae bacterium]|nr:hypothetical protein [Rikenellaceae bacterium]
MKLGIRRCRIPLGGDQVSEKYRGAQIEVEKGIYVLTQSSTNSKKKILDLIADNLGIPLKVEIIKPE